MIANYRSFTVSAKPNENIVQKIYKILQEEGYHNAFFELKYIGFYGEQDTTFKLNGNDVKIPSNGYFTSPYSPNDYLKIHSISFDEGCEERSFWCIY